MSKCRCCEMSSASGVRGRGRGAGRGRCRGPPPRSDRFRSKQSASGAFQHPDIVFWKQRVHHWYPRFLERTYFVPPVYMNKVQYRQVQFAGLELDVTEPPVASLPRGAPVILQKSAAREDQSHQRILHCLHKFAEKQNEIMFVISQLQFVDFLANATFAAAAKLLPRAADLKKENKHRGDFDLLFIHKNYGAVVAEIKTVGGNFSNLSLTEDEQDVEIAKRLEKAVKQLNKEGEVLMHLMSDIRSPPQIRKAVILPNVSKCQLRRVLANNSSLSADLCGCLHIQDSADLVSLCLCEDHLSDRNTPYDVTIDTIKALSEWWIRRVAGPYISIADDIYEDLVARFCGPATTVAVFCPTVPCISLHTEGEGVAETSRRFARFVLHPDQLFVLSTNPPCAFLTGPPGTGKTLVLVVTSLNWLRHGLEVHVVSTWWGSLAASHLIVHQVTSTENVAAERVHLHLFDLQEDGQVEEAVEDLVKASKHSGPLCVIADEVCGSEFTDFCNTLLKHVPDTRLWAASLYHGNRPPCLTEVRMTEPLRTPPVVTREVQKAYWIEKFGAVLNYSESSVPSPTEGLDSKILTHRGQSHATGRPTECELCGAEVARLLRELHVGQRGNTAAETETSITAARNTGNKSSASPVSPPPLQYRDVFILTANVFPEAILHDDEKDSAGKVVNPASGMLRGLRKAGVPVRVLSGSRDHDAIAGVAKMAGEDEVVAAEVGLVRGLERKIVVWVQTDRPVSGTEDESWGRLDGLSRATGHAIRVIWPQDD